ncbi:hypothetical protein KAX02_03780 [candidate division WOR-3 bacterium]|nr:hypothetical protein [candidate division WOR-3 bacterium]
MKYPFFAIPLIISFLGCATTPIIRLNSPKRPHIEIEYTHERIKIKHPLILSYRGIYLNCYAARNVEKYIERMSDTELNCVVIDFKNDIGLVTYNTNVQFARRVGAVKNILDLEGVIKACNENGVYLIGRIVVFKDSIFSKYNGGEFGVKYIDGRMWRDRAGNLWLDQYSIQVWDYVIDIAIDLAVRGVREIQFDYVRFPSRGDMEAMWFSHKTEDIPKEDLIVEFLKRAYIALKPYGVNVAVDLYGYTMWLESMEQEGQNLSKIEKWVDVVCPMLYPSHFHDDFKKDTNPREYHIVYESLKNGYRKIGKEKFVSYIQGFNLKSPNFGPVYFENQIRAVKDARARGYIFWNARSDYSILFQLLEAEN